jgi:hypothetical protein
MRTLAALLLLSALLAGCGSSAQSAKRATAPKAKPGPGRVLYIVGPWAVVVDGTRATAYHRLGGTWRADRSGAVRITILGPQPGSRAPRLPQVAAELIATTPLVESGLWVDGKELFEKGGGLSPKRGTIYGAPAARLAPGRHVAVAYARTAANATAVAWTFRAG